MLSPFLSRCRPEGRAEFGPAHPPFSNLLTEFQRLHQRCTLNLAELCSITRSGLHLSFRHLDLVTDKRCTAIKLGSIDQIFIASYQIKIGLARPFVDILEHFPTRLPALSDSKFFLVLLEACKKISVVREVAVIDGHPRHFDILAPSPRIYFCYCGHRKCKTKRGCEKTAQRNIFIGLNLLRWSLESHTSKGLAKADFQFPLAT